MLVCSKTSSNLFCVLYTTRYLRIMKILKVLALTLFCVSSALANPAKVDELRELRRFQIEALSDLEQRTGFRSSRTVIEKLVEVETMLKLYSRVSDEVRGSSSGNVHFGSKAKPSLSSTSHLELLRRYQETYLKEAGVLLKSDSSERGH